MAPAHMDPSPRHLVLLGGMGTGKTSVGRELARHLGRPLLDSDVHILATGRRGRELAARDGVAALHQAEAEHLLSALGSDDPSVVAAAASVVDGDRTLEALREPDVVWLRARPGTAAERIAGTTHRRDLGPDATATLAALDDRRASRYGEVADLVIDTDDLGADVIAAEVLSWLRALHG